MKARLEGGKRAAGLLTQAVEEELRSSLPAVNHHVQVVIRVYANMKGLAKTYKDAEVLPQVASLDDFVRGFNMGDPMCDYVDAGNGKECSDEKIKGMQYTFRRRHANTDSSKQCFGSIWRTCTASKSSSAAQPIMAMPGCWAHVTKTTQSEARLPC